MARNPWTKDCAIKGCTRAAYKAQICRMHYQRVPLNERMRVALDAMIASHNAARRGHARIRRIAKELA